MGEQVALHNDQLQLESGLLLLLSSLGHKCLPIVPHTSAVQQHCTAEPISTWIPGPPGSLDVHVSSILDPSSFTHQPGTVGFLEMRQGLLFGVQAAVIAKITFHYHPHYLSHICSFFKQPFVCEEIDVIRKLRIMGNSIRPNLVLVKNQNEASAHETDQALSGACL